MMKVIIGLSLNQFEIPNISRNIKRLSFLQDSEIHWVHIFERQSAILGLPEHLKLTKKQEAEIQQNLLEELKKRTSNVLAEASKQTYHCLIEDSRKRGFVNFCLENSPDLVLMTCKQKAGINQLFGSSFADYMQENLPFNTLLLK